MAAADATCGRQLGSLASTSGCDDSADVCLSIDMSACLSIDMSACLSVEADEARPPEDLAQHLPARLGRGDVRRGHGLTRLHHASTL